MGRHQRPPLLPCRLVDSLFRVVASFHDRLQACERLRVDEVHGGGGAALRGEIRVLAVAHDIYLLPVYRVEFEVLVHRLGRRRSMLLQEFHVYLVLPGARAREHHAVLACPYDSGGDAASPRGGDDDIGVWDAVEIIHARLEFIAYGGEALAEHRVEDRHFPAHGESPADVFAYHAVPHHRHLRVDDGAVEVVEYFVYRAVDGESHVLRFRGFNLASGYRVGRYAGVRIRVLVAPMAKRRDLHESCHAVVYAGIIARERPREASAHLDDVCGSAIGPAKHSLQIAG